MTHATKIKKWIGFTLMGLFFLGISFTVQGEDGSCERWGKMLVEDEDGYEVEKIVLICDVDVVLPTTESPTYPEYDASYDGGSSYDSSNKGENGGDYLHQGTGSATK